MHFLSKLTMTVLLFLTTENSFACIFNCGRNPQATIESYLNSEMNKSFSEKFLTSHFREQPNAFDRHVSFFQSANMGWQLSGRTGQFLTTAGNEVTLSLSALSTKFVFTLICDNSAYCLIDDVKMLVSDN